MVHICNTCKQITHVHKIKNKFKKETANQKGAEYSRVQDICQLLLPFEENSALNIHTRTHARMHTVRECI